MSAIALAVQRLIRRIQLYPVAGLLMCAHLSACATIMNGTRQRVRVTSNPPGAQVSVDGVVSAVTPATVRLTRRSGHLITVTRDSARMDFRVERRLSLWVFGNLLIGTYPVVVDLVTGAMFGLTPSSLAAVLPRAGAVAEALPAAAVRDTAPPPAAVAPPIRPGLGPDNPWGIRNGDRIQIRRESRVAMDVVVDSGPGGLTLSWTNSPFGALPIDSSDLASGTVLFRGPPLRLTNALTNVRHMERAALAVGVAAASAGEVAVALDAVYVGAVSVPLAMLTGAAAADPRWATVDANRRPPLLYLDDVVRLPVNGTRREARVVDVQAEHLVVAFRRDTVRFARGSVPRLERADGFAFGQAMRWGALGSAAVGLALCPRDSGTPCTPRDALIPAAAGAVFGALFSPAFAPRRWTALSW